MASGSFFTVINCMDGRTQLPVNKYLSERYQVDYVDTVTEAGPVGVLAQDMACDISKSILERVEISLNAHHSKGVAMVAHYDCAGYPEPKEKQLEDLKVVVDSLAKRYPDVPILGVWVDEEWIVSEVCLSEPSA